MITKWKLGNFKSIRKQTELPMGPLTIFAGPNSSGKSTFIQSILLINQTLTSQVRSRSVILNGPLTKLGQFHDLRSFGRRRANRILIEWECELAADRQRASLTTPMPVAQRSVYYGRRGVRLERVSYSMSFGPDPSDDQRELTQLQPTLFGCTITCVARTRDGAGIRARLAAKRSESEKLQHLHVPQPDSEAVLASLDYDVTLDNVSQRELRDELTSAEPVGCSFNHFLPSRLTVLFDEAEEEASLIATAICGQGTSFGRRATSYLYDEDIPIPATVMDLLTEQLGDLVRPILEASPQTELFSEEQGIPATLTLSDWHDRVRRLRVQQRMRLRREIQARGEELATEIHAAVKRSKDSRLNIEQLPLPRAILESALYLYRYFSNSVKYLGPLRDEPKALYPLSAVTNTSDVGLRGEYTAAVLDLHRNRDVEHIPSKHFQTPTVEEESLTCSLREAVVDWLHYLGVAEEIKTRDLGNLGHELKVTSHDVDKPHDLTHVGVGVSQVLPILVTSLMADTDTVLIFEQPELHLHPRVQSRLADFFLSMSLLGKQCLIETHSEHLINRLRLRVASAPNGMLSPIIKMYFVERTKEGSSFQPVAINEYGAIPDWPKGFFDQSQQEAEEILKAAMAKRRNERESNSGV